jgi:sialic acid synthase SpsE
MSTLQEVRRAYKILVDSGARSVSILHCITNYPCKFEEANLRVISTYKKIFKTKIGYSDHTLGIEAPIAAVALGAEIIEKHFTLNKTMEGPDHKASIDPIELKNMINSIRNIEKALGNGIKKPTRSEETIKNVVRKKIVAAVDIEKGELFTKQNLALKRNNKGLNSSQWEKILGKCAKKEFLKDEPISI